MKRIFQVLKYVFPLLLLLNTLTLYANTLSQTSFTTPCIINSGYPCPVFLKADGTLWGYEGTDDLPKLHLIASDVKSVDGDDHSIIFLTSDGSVWTFDYIPASSDENIYFPYVQSTPQCVLKDATAITVNGLVYGAIKRDGSLWTWTNLAILRVPDFITVEPPPLIEKPKQIASQVTSIKSTSYEIIYEKKDKSLWSYELKNEQYMSTALGTQVASYKTGYDSIYYLNTKSELWHINALHESLKITDDVIDYTYSYALKSDGTVLYTSSYPNTHNPNDLVPFLKGVKAIKGSSEPLFIKEDGSVWTTYFSYSPFLSYEETKQCYLVNLGTSIEDADLAKDYSYILLKDGSLWLGCNPYDLFQFSRIMYPIPGVNVPDSWLNHKGAFVGCCLFTDFAPPTTTAHLKSEKLLIYDALPSWISTKVYEGYYLIDYKQSADARFNFSITQPNPKRLSADWDYTLLGQNNTISQINTVLNLDKASDWKTNTFDVTGIESELTDLLSRVSKLIDSPLTLSPEEVHELASAIAKQRPYKKEFEKLSIECWNYDDFTYVTPTFYTYMPPVSIILKDTILTDQTNFVSNQEIKPYLALGFSKSDITKQLEDTISMAERTTTLTGYKKVASPQFSLRLYGVATTINERYSAPKDFLRTRQEHQISFSIGQKEWFSDPSAALSQLKAWVAAHKDVFINKEIYTEINTLITRFPKETIIDASSIYSDTLKYASFDFMVDGWDDYFYITITY